MSELLNLAASSAAYLSPQFVLVANDQELLRLLDLQFKKQGYVAVVQDNKKIEYYIDCRQGIGTSKHQINRILEQTQITVKETGVSYLNYTKRHNRLIQAVLLSYGLDLRLQGVKMLKYILEHSNCSPQNLRPLTHRIYPQVAKQFVCAIQQVNRAINYALRKSNFNGSTYDLLANCTYMLNELERAQLNEICLQKMSLIELSELAKKYQINQIADVA